MTFLIGLAIGYIGRGYVSTERLKSLALVAWRWIQELRGK
jgi:hypothetical protein